VTVDTTLDTIKRLIHPGHGAADIRDKFGKWGSAWVSSAVNGSSGIRSAPGVSHQVTGCWRYGQVPGSFTSHGRDLPAILTRTLALLRKRLTLDPPATWCPDLVGGRLQTFGISVDCGLTFGLSRLP